METESQINPPVAPTAPRSRVGMRVATLFFLLLIIGLAVLIGQRVKEALAQKEKVAAERGDVQASAAKRAPVQATHPVRATWKPRVEMTGTLKPWREADVGFETVGRLSRVSVSVGDTVKQGQTMALLDAARASEMVAVKEAGVRAAKGNLALAEDAAQRAKHLAESGSIPDAHSDQARLQAELARANLQAAVADVAFSRTGVGQTAAIAPFAGVVTRAPTAAGGVVQPGSPLIHLEDLSRLRLSATVSEDDVPLVRIGEPVTVKYRDRTVIGKIVALVPSLDQTTRRAPMEIEVPNDPSAPLLAYSFVHATITSDREVAALRVPSIARRPGSQDEIVKVDNGKAKLVRVVYALDTDGSWIVQRAQSGTLELTDVIILSPDSQTRDGDVLPDIVLEGAR